MLHFDERNEFAALLDTMLIILCINLDEDFKWLSFQQLLDASYASSHRKFETLKVIFKKKTISIIRIFLPLRHIKRIMGPFKIVLNCKKKIRAECGGGPGLNLKLILVIRVLDIFTLKLLSNFKKCQRQFCLFKFKGWQVLCRAEGHDW